MLVRLRFYIPEIVLGLFLAITIFGMGMLFSSSQQTPSHQQHQTESSAAKSQPPQQDRPHWWGHSDPGVTTATVLLFLVGIAQAIMFYVQLRYMQRGMDDAKIAADAATASATTLRNQLTLAFPPRLIVTAIAIHKKGTPDRRPPDLVAGEKIEAFVWLVNAGREHADIGDHYCMAYWCDGPLPMYRPTPKDNPSLPRAGNLQKSDGTGINDLTEGPDINRMERGEVAFWRFETTVPDPPTTLYVIGGAVYFDRMNTRRAVIFGQRYDVGEQRFVRLKDHPFDSEE